MNNAIWIDENNELSLRGIEETYIPQAAQILVEVKFSGINPADIKHGLHLNLNTYPAGYEYAGKVIKIGPESNFKLGAFVFGHNLPGRKKPIYYGAHQDFVIGEHFIYNLPKGMPPQDSACVSIMAQTAADALFNQLELPSSILGDEAAKVPILIWGGSSNVGAAAIQLAHGAGLTPIFTTASHKNHDRLRTLGATECFDYKDPNVVENIKSAVMKCGKPLKHIFDTVGSRGSKSSTDLCEVCGDENARLVAALPVPGRPRWKMVLATRNVDFPFPRPDGSIHWVKAMPLWQDRIDKTFQWCLQNYGTRFLVPNVRVVKGGEEGIMAMKYVADGKSSLEKVVIEHPL